MGMRAPIKLNNKLSRLSVIALVGLVAFAAVILVANPFAQPASGAGSPGQAATSPSTGAQTGVGTQGSLLTTPPSGGSSSGGTHHHHDDGNFTGDS
jgi:hypothetical protein